ncbi:DUF3667 domain-containing protein [Allosphingosinicella flava]|uniref:DUF3667 domain-containing protein n=1 Tax=Allosphingosinicella flava TaxID=2771430 RepID=A0A7T2LL92_9SPHN|nr:DUF3667 domain-containing protein [Sphingosinicella flava]QPQ54189.1 DUF3667 domain-containing protein [Sphingosinicella flava]
MGGEGIEAIGDLATGGMVARAVEPKAGEAAHGYGGQCLNCGTALAGDYCHACGQAGHVHRSLMAWWHDLAHGILHLDGKVWRTLPLLAWRPGDLTRRYVEGERAKFVSPMALFLFSAFLMFVTFSTIGGPFETNFAPPDKAEIQAERVKADARLAELEKQRDAAAAKGEDTRGIREEIADTQRETSALKIATGDTGTLRVEGADWIRHAIEKARANPDLLLYKLQNNAYKFSWALIPLSVPFVALLFLFRGRRHRMYDHTVFVTYSIAFMTLGTVTLSFLRVIGLLEGWIGFLILIIPPLHMYRQLKGAYALSRFGALWRTAMLLLFAFLAFILFLAGIGLMGAM